MTVTDPFAQKFCSLIQNNFGGNFGLMKYRAKFSKCTSLSVHVPSTTVQDAAPQISGIVSMKHCCTLPLCNPIAVSAPSTV